MSPSPAQTLPPAVCVFCGASARIDVRHLERARHAGIAIVRHGLGVVYGGAASGCMGALADGALSADGAVHGVVPRWLESREFVHPRLTSVRHVEGLAQRKAEMLVRSRAVLVLAGGIGTLDEFFEVLTLRALGVEPHAIAVFDPDGVHADLRRWFEHVGREGFVSDAVQSLVRWLDSEKALDGWLAEVRAA